MELFDKDTLTNEDKKLDLKKKLTGDKIYMEMEDLEKLFEELGQTDSFFVKTIKSYSDEDYKNVHPFLVSTLEENFKSEQFKKEILLQFGQNDIGAIHEMNTFLTEDVLLRVMDSPAFSKEKKELIAKALINPLLETEAILTDAFMSKNPINVEIKIDENGTLPTYAHPTDAGADLYASEDIDLQPNSFGNLVQTNISVATPIGYECRVSLRSGIAKKTKLRLSNGIGVVDTNYRGKVGILLDNFDDKVYSVKKGERLAQIVFAKVSYANFIEVDELDETDRGEGGFGSTGKN
jgi:dUTP pyrophosphatase